MKFWETKKQCQWSRNKNRVEKVNSKGILWMNISEGAQQAQTIVLVSWLEKQAQLINLYLCIWWHAFPFPWKWDSYFNRLCVCVCVCVCIWFWVALCLCRCTGFLLSRVQGTLSTCGARPSCSGFSRRRAQALGVWTSVVVVHGLRCSSACRISLDQELNLCSLH